MQLPQTIAILALLALASAHAIRRDEAKADFSKTCENITVRKGGNHLEAECTSTNGEKMKSSLDLNFCIRHTYGGMEAHTDGHFYGNPGCTGCQILKDSPNTLQCVCGTSQVGAFKKATLDLDIMVSNNDGLTECHGHRADKI
ncbi:CVNH domain-containing protein [Aspergillus pseudonomiae]|uniref:CVNH domain-containing protein n=1 Tax=Aspergillus pseudonomiae TaxID=1506151 RepID=A0A5N6ID15_9EURO|nr:CVNH domain-containing protein [Aspergillus pseudonomiae]KAB8263680.1 CVNH domain-containing protein [Aspergillus pseudonomiae]KAE8408546.1 CVNH domain-containing protein [Aspergillus pseudonomiae]